MRRYIILLLITGIVWAQTDFDRLVMKDGTIYSGEYSKTEEEIVYFKPQNAFAFQPVPVPLIKRLKLKDGDYIIGISRRERSKNTILLCTFLIIVSYNIIIYENKNKDHTPRKSPWWDLNYNDADN